MLPYTIEEITHRITPIAQKYKLTAVYLFGSYARGEATPDSDVDLLVDLDGSTAHGIMLGALYSDLADALQVSSLKTPTTKRGQIHFREAVNKERRMIYAAA